MPAQRPVQRMILRLFFFSGLSGILFEVLWTRIFTFVLGSSIQSVSAVVTAFMLGLGLGAWIFGRRADRVSNPLRLYGTLELGVAVSGLGALWLFTHLQGVYAIAYAGLSPTVVKWLVFAVAFAFITAPATLIGGTLPALVRYVVERDDQLHRSLGLLYAVNTLGAAFGAVLMLGLVWCFGYPRSYAIALAVNVATGLGALWLSRGARPMATAAPDAPAQATSVPPGSGLILAAFAVSGFCALAYEVVWFRAFDYLLLGKLTTFAIVLATYLLGISLGSLAFSRFTRPRMGNVALFVVLEGLVGLAGLLSMPLLAAVTSPSHRGLGIGVFFAVIFSVTFVLGGLLPLAGQLSSGPVTVLGRSIGNLYSANTLGSVIGSFGAGFVLIPLLGTGPTYFLAAMLNLAIAFAVALWHPDATHGAKRLTTGALLAAAATGLWLSADWTTRYEAGASLRPGFQVIAKKEGPLQTVMVAQDPSGDRVLMGGPFQSGETVFTRRQTQRLQAQLPMLLHPNPQHVLEIGYGVGEIARTVELYHPAELRLVEIDKNMIPMANAYFGALNDHASEQPNVKTDIMDGRLFLRMTHEHFDVILSDSMILASEGSLRLYTLEHFEQARAHLNPGGMMICWLPMNVGVAKSLVIIKTFLEAFPNTRLWLPLGHNTEEAYLVGYRSADEMGIDLDAFVARYQTIAAPELRAFGWNSPALFFGSFRAGPARLAELTSKVPFINRDLNPVVDFLPTDPPAAIRNWVATLVREDPAFVLPALHAKGEGRALLASLPGELGQIHQADLAFLKGVDRLASYGDAPPAEVLAKRDQATHDFRDALAHDPRHHAARVWIAMVDDLAESAQPPLEPARRKALLEEALSMDPTDVVAARGLAELAQAAGDATAAARLRAQVRALSPYDSAPLPTASRRAPTPTAAP